MLDDRCKRRIRRNGLSEEINDYEADKKDRADLEKQVQAKDEELRRLREELESAKHTDMEGDVADASSSSQRIDEVEAELAVLRESFNGATAVDDDLADINWDHVNVYKAGATPGGPPSDGGDTIQIYEDEDAMIADTTIDAEDARPDHEQDAELLAMALDLESARAEKRQLFQELRHHMPAPSSSTDMHFADSPSCARQNSDSYFLSLNSPPKDFYRNISAVLKATTSRAEDAELALHNLEASLRTLGFAGSDSSAIITEITKQFRTVRLELERAVPGETVPGLSAHASVLPEVIAKLRMLVRHVGEREAELKTMREQQKTLKGNFEHSIRSAEKASARTRELEDAIECGAEEMLGMRMKVQALEKDGLEKDKSIASLITALEKYREDVSRLEQLVTQLESEMSLKAQETQKHHAQQVSDLEAKISAEERGRRAAESSAVERLAKIHELEHLLSSAEARVVDTQLQLSALSAEKEEEEFKLMKKLHEKDEQAQAQLGALGVRISNLSTALASANAEVDKLKVHKVKLEERVRMEVEQGERAVEIMQTELVRSLAKVNESKKSYLRGAKIRVANGELRDAEEDDEDLESGGAEPMTPVSLVRFVDVEADEEHVAGSVEVRRGKGRRRSRKGETGEGKGRKRRYDSGIGMDTLSEEDEFASGGATAMVGLGFSSETDYDGMES